MALTTEDSALIDGLVRKIGLQCFAVLTKQKYEDLDPSIKRIVGAGDYHTGPSIKSQEILACSFWSTSRPPTQLMTTIICSSVPQVYLRRWSFQVPVYLPQMPDIPSAPPDMLNKGKPDPIVAVVEDWMSDILDISVQLTVTRLWAQAMIAMQEDDENYDMSKLQRMGWMMPNKGV
ncbi:hypothetical protein BC940DRAFT_318348 [Gongronella butleri]|nr:hypothetical protein BC940DRAFT_318348 [Gongronella butleri]